MSAPTSDWRAMGAGRELDALVAERVMGTPVTMLPTGLSASDPHYFAVDAGGSHWARVPSYSTDIAAAWLVVESVESRGWKLAYRTQGIRQRRVEIEISPRDLKGPSALYAGEADTAPLTICRAALAACEDAP